MKRRAGSKHRPSKAIKFTPKGGHITIYARHESQTEVRIAVRDTSPEMPPEQLPQVLGRFGQEHRRDEFIFTMLVFSESELATR
jgi:hypothetical protein